MPVDQNSIGSHGELTAAKLLSRRYGRPDPYFRPELLGNKHPAIDLFVELVGDNGDQAPFFFAQVKATSLGYNQRRRLKVRLTASAIESLIHYPGPTYVIGVDEIQEQAFIMAATVGGPTSLASFPVIYPLADEAVLVALYEEVRAYWRTHAAQFMVSRFSEGR